MATICAYARYEDTAGDGVDGIVVTWDIDRVVRDTGVRDALVTGGANNIVFGRDGLYGYRLTGADIITYDYLFTAITASALPTAHEVAALWTLWSLSWHDVLTGAITVVGSIGEFILSLPILSDFFTVNTGQTQPGNPGSPVYEILDGINTVAFPAGALEVTFTSRDSTTLLPVEGVEVWMATDAAYVNIVWKGDSDAFGIARDVTGAKPLLDPGTYYVREQRAGFADKQSTIVVS